MKSIGMIRQLDELGRVVLPKELREAFNLKRLYSDIWGESKEIF